jgi:16S rRNA C1402 N4-methylase RsmH
MLVAQRYLKLGGRMVTITFHSLEDTIVKRHLMGNVSNDVPNQTPLKYISQSVCHDKEIMESFLQTPWKQINKHVLTPRMEEIERNPRSRSAKLRAAIKISC